MTASTDSWILYVLARTVPHMDFLLILTQSGDLIDLTLYTDEKRCQDGKNALLDIFYDKKRSLR